MTTADDEPKQPATRRVYTDEFKRDAVARIDAGETMAAVAKDLDIHPNVLRNWRQVPPSAGGAFSSTSTTLGSEPYGGDFGVDPNAALRRENALLRAEIDYLKRREAILRG